MKRTLVDEDDTPPSKRRKTSTGLGKRRGRKYKKLYPLEDVFGKYLVVFEPRYYDSYGDISVVGVVHELPEPERNEEEEEDYRCMIDEYWETPISLVINNFDEPMEKWEIVDVKDCKVLKVQGLREDNYVIAKESIVYRYYYVSSLNNIKRIEICTQVDYLSSDISLKTTDELIKAKVLSLAMDRSGTKNNVNTENSENTAQAEKTGATAETQGDKNGEKILTMVAKASTSNEKEKLAKMGEWHCQNNKFLCEIGNLLTEEECQSIINIIHEMESNEFECENLGLSFQSMEDKYEPNIRNNSRLLIHDQDFADMIWNRLSKHIFCNNNGSNSKGDNIFKQNGIRIIPLGFDVINVNNIVTMAKNKQQGDKSKGKKGEKEQKEKEGEREEATKMIDEIISDCDEWVVNSVNPAFRINRYNVHDHFSAHKDSQYVKNGYTRSIFSLIIYLNDDFSNGETKFYWQKQKNDCEISENVKDKNSNQIEENKDNKEKGGDKKEHKEKEKEKEKENGKNGKMEDISMDTKTEKGEEKRDLILKEMDKFDANMYDCKVMKPKTGNAVMFDHSLMHEAVPPVFKYDNDDNDDNDDGEDSESEDEDKKRGKYRYVIRTDVICIRNEKLNDKRGFAVTNYESKDYMDCLNYFREAQRQELLYQKIESNFLYNKAINIRYQYPQKLIDNLIDDLVVDSSSNDGSSTTTSKSRSLFVSLDKDILIDWVWLAIFDYLPIREIECVGLLFGGSLYQTVNLWKSEFYQTRLLKSCSSKDNNNKQEIPHHIPQVVFQFGSYNVFEFKDSNFFLQNIDSCLKVAAMYSIFLFSNRRFNEPRNSRFMNWNYYYKRWLRRQGIGKNDKNKNIELMYTSEDDESDDEGDDAIKDKQQDRRNYYVCRYNSHTQEALAVSLEEMLTDVFYDYPCFGSYFKIEKKGNKCNNNNNTANDKDNESNNENSNIKGKQHESDIDYDESVNLSLDRKYMQLKHYSQYVGGTNELLESNYRRSCEISECHTWSRYDGFKFSGDELLGNVESSIVNPFVYDESWRIDASNYSDVIYNLSQDCYNNDDNKNDNKNNNSDGNDDDLKSLGVKRMANHEFGRDYSLDRLIRRKQEKMKKQMKKCKSGCYHFLDINAKEVNLCMCRLGDNETKLQMQCIDFKNHLICDFSKNTLKIYCHGDEDDESGKIRDANGNRVCNFNCSDSKNFVQTFFNYLIRFRKTENENNKNEKKAKEKSKRKRSGKGRGYPNRCYGNGEKVIDYNDIKYFIVNIEDFYNFQSKKDEICFSHASCNCETPTMDVNVSGFCGYSHLSHIHVAYFVTKCNSVLVSTMYNGIVAL